MRTRKDKCTKVPLGIRLVHPALLLALIVAGAWAQTKIDMEVSTSSVTAPPEFRGAATPTPSVTPTPNPAEESARKILPVPGTSLRTTEESDFATTDEQAQAPSVRLSGGQLQSADGTTSEQMAVESAADLLTKLRIVVPRRTAATGTREIDETTPTELFNDEEILRLIGRDPTVLYQVVYKATPIPDPMVVPWVRNAVVLKERFDEALQLLTENKVDQGREALLDIEAQFPESEYAVQAREILKRLREIEAQPTPQTSVRVQATPTATPIQIVIDPNVRISTVIADPARPEDNRVMINGRMYGIGETIREFPNHKVIGITDDDVKIEVEVSGVKKEFAVPVRQPRAKR